MKMANFMVLQPSLAIMEIGMLHEKTKNFVKSQHKFDFTKSEIFYHFFLQFCLFLEKSEPGFPANWTEHQSITTPVDQ